MGQNENRMWVQTLWNPINETEKSPLESKQQGIRVAAYCRVSCGTESRRKSLDNQVSHYTLFIKSRPNWRFVGIYFDEGASGANYKNRRGFKRLLRHCEEGKIDVILTKNVSRFSRNSRDLLDVVNRLKEQNVSVYFEKENIDTSVDYNRFLLSAYAALAQEEIETVSQSTKWGFEKQFLKGIPKYTRMLGYEIIKNKGIPSLKINKEESEVVVRIFDMFLSGFSFAEIARELMKQRVKTAAGKELWRGSVVRNIINNITYTGNKLARQRTGDMFTGSAQSDRRDQILIENCHPAIISTEVFNKAQKRMEKIKPYLNENKRRKKSPLSGRMECGHCGYNLNKDPTASGNYWVCSLGKIGAFGLKFIKENIIREMMLKAIDKNYCFKDAGVIAKLLKAIQIVNQNDHFEFHRLKYLTEIEIAKKEKDISLMDTHVDINKMEIDYLDFEEKIARIEDDREYRDAAVEWIQRISGADEFIEKATIEHMRAWITRMKIFSRDDYIVFWVDDTQTTVGRCSKYRKARITSDSKPAKKSKKRDSDPIASTMKEERVSQAIDYNGTYRKGGNEELYLNQNIEVTKIESAQADFLMKDLQKRADKDAWNYNMQTSKTKTKIRAAAYCRISTDHEEQKLSLKTQIAYYTYRILKNPAYEYAGIFADEGISGKSLKNRTEFLKLMDECKAGNIDLILTKSISRFSRNCVDCIDAVRMLKSLPKPVYVYFEKENIHTKDEQSEFMISIFGSVAQEEIINMGAAVSWGMRRYAERGIVKLGKPNYGYEYSKSKQWVIKEEEAEIIRRIFKDALDGKNYNQISNELTKEGIKSPSGKNRWCPGTVRLMLKNEVYRGNYLYQKHYTKDTLEEKIVKNKGELPQYLIENHHVGIINSDDWEAVQLILRECAEAFENKKQKRYPKESLKNKALDNKFRCGECGNIIGHKRECRKAHALHIWICNLAQKCHAVDRCDSRRYQQKYLELNFMSMLLSIKNNPEFKSEMDKLFEAIDLNNDELCLEDDIKKRIEDINHRLYEAVDEELGKKGRDTRLVDELSENIVSLQNKLKSYSKRKELVGQYRKEMDWLKDELQKLDERPIRNYEGLGKDKTVPFREDIFMRLIDSGKIFKDGRIVYKLKLGIEWSVDFRYEDYKRIISNKKDDAIKAKKEKYMKGPEIKALLEFCAEPKGFSEMLKFMNTMRTISSAHFRNTIVRPLREAGRLKWTIPEDPQNKEQKYYSVK